MPSILFVCLHRPDRSPSQRFRFEQYLTYLEANGFDCRISYLLGPKYDKVFYSNGNYFQKAVILITSLFKRTKEILFKQADIVFVQRESIMLGTAFFEKMYARKSKLIFDFDDSIWINTVSEGNKSLAFLKNSDKIKEIIKIADLVIVGNNYLANYALRFNSNVFIFPTTINTDIHKHVPIIKSDRICIGWTGSFSTIQYFKLLENVLILIKEKYNEKVYFKVIGDKHYHNELLGIKGVAWKAENEIIELNEIDIGIMPLVDDEWAMGKCALKCLQYMSLGIPSVISPVGVNKDIIQDGSNGFLANSDEEWVEKLSILIENPELRKTIGQKGLETVETKYSVKANQEKYLGYFTSLLQP